MRHVWQEDENPRRVKCVMCGAEFLMGEDEYETPGLSLSALAQSRGVPPTCEEERVRQVMES